MPLFEDTRGNLTKNLGAFPLFQSVQAEYALKAMSTSLSETVGEQGSLYDLLQKIFGMSYCELAMIPTAPMVIADVVKVRGQTCPRSCRSCGLGLGTKKQPRPADPRQAHAGPDLNDAKRSQVGEGSSACELMGQRLSSVGPSCPS